MHYVTQPLGISSHLDETYPEKPFYFWTLNWDISWKLNLFGGCLCGIYPSLIRGYLSSLIKFMLAWPLGRWWCWLNSIVDAFSIMQVHTRNIALTTFPVTLPVKCQLLTKTQKLQTNLFQLQTWINFQQ
jgi:hypothetical protein